MVSATFQQPVEKAHDRVRIEITKGARVPWTSSLRPGTFIHFIDGSVGNEKNTVESLRDWGNQRCGTLKEPFAHSTIHDLIHCLERGGSPICGLKRESAPFLVSSVFEFTCQGGKVVGFRSKTESIHLRSETNCAQSIDQRQSTPYFDQVKIHYFAA